jgi:hypothetical protein
MPRIAADVADAREKLAYEAFAANPKRTVADVQEELEERDGFKMNLGRIYQIANAAKAKEPLPAKIKTTKKSKKRKVH